MQSEALRPIPIDRAELDREIVKKGGLYSFLKLAWPHVDSSEFKPGWHLEEVCKHLEAVSSGKLKRLIINIPPGLGKSLTVSVFWPVWDWIVNPWRRFMFASFDITLSHRDALRAKELIQSDWFQERWGFKADQEKLSARGLSPISTNTTNKQNTASVYWSTGGGLRFSTSVGGRATGWHAHIQVVDDPNKPKDAENGTLSKAALEKTKKWYSGTMASRKVDAATFARVIMMQRIHEDDLSGAMEATGEWVVLRLPMEYEADNPCRTPIGGDRRTKEGELLCPERFPKDTVEETKKDMGPRVAAAQLQQRPSPEGGTIFKREWFKTYTVLPRKIRMIQSWDCTFKDSTTADYVVGQVWGASGPDFYLIDEKRDRMDLPATCQAIREMSLKYPKARLKLIENKANGPAVEQTLRSEISGIVLVEPQGGKVARANAVSPYCEAGNVYLPNVVWLKEWLDEVTGFPFRRFDDRVDAKTQAILRLSGKYRPNYARAMAKIRRENV